MDVLMKLRQLMRQNNWTEYQLSKQSGVPQSTINSMFRKHNFPTIPTLESMCHAFGITLSDFFSDGQTANTSTTEQIELFEKWSTLPQEKKYMLLKLIGYL